MLVLTFWPYLALVFVLIVSSAGPPLPATLSLTLAAVAARQGHNNLMLLLIVATLATTLGDVVGYVVGRLAGLALGRTASTAWWRTHRLTSGVTSHLSRQATQAVTWLETRGGIGGPLVFVSRWGLTPIAPAINLLVGARRYPFKRFIIWDSTGEALWVARVVFPAYILGKSAGLASIPLALGATVILGALISLGVGRLFPALPPTQASKHPLL